MLFHASLVPSSVAFQFLEETIFHDRHTEIIVMNKDTEGFEVFTAVAKKNAVSWDVPQCGFIVNRSVASIFMV
jgi:hypothetical protein